MKRACGPMSHVQVCLAYVCVKKVIERICNVKFQQCPILIM